MDRHYKGSAISIEPANAIRRCADGSIDSTWYITRGRAERGIAAFRLIQKLCQIVFKTQATLRHTLREHAQKNCKANFTTCKSLNPSFRHQHEQDLS